MARQDATNDDRDINELLSTSLSNVFPDNRKLGKLEESTTESTELELSEDESSDYLIESRKTTTSFEQSENGDVRVTEIDEDSDQSMNFRDIFPEYQKGIDDSFVEFEDSFTKILCDVDIRKLRKEQRKKVVKALFSPMKSLVKKPIKKIPAVKIPLVSRPGNIPTVIFRSKRKRVSFSGSPVYINEEEKTEEFIEDAFALENSCELYPEEVDSMWYNDVEYHFMKQEVLRTMDKIVRCHSKKREFIENEHQTARGLELVTKEMILERKNYKIASRHIVFDEQEEQRISYKSNPERIRELYIEATSKAKGIALEYGWKDQEAVHVLNEASFCIHEE